MRVNEKASFYEVLDIDPDASPQRIREAYVRSKATYNRDNVVLYSLISPEEREEILTHIEEAYSILSDPERRRQYDQNFAQFSPNENPFEKSNNNVVSIDRVPPMETSTEEEKLLIPPSTDTPTTSVSEEFEPPKRTEIKHLPSSSNPSSASSFMKSHSPIAEHLPRPIKTATELRMVISSLDTELIQAIEKEVEWKGSFLKKVREASQISLEEMSGATKLSKNYLTAIEEEAFSRLPAPVFVRGFVMQIAKILKLPHEAVVKAYLARYTATRK